MSFRKHKEEAVKLIKGKWPWICMECRAEFEFESQLRKHEKEKGHNKDVN